jgi:penicillin-binding protein 2
MSAQPHSSEAQDYYEERRLSRRITVLQILFAAVFIVFLMTFWYHQVVRTDHYRRLSDNNRLRRVTAMPLRGEITDRDERLLATNRIAFNMHLNREKVRDVDRLLPVLSGILDTDEQILRERLDRYRDRPRFEPVVLKEDVELAEVAYVESRRASLPMLSVEVESRRDYPYGPLAAHVLGYVGEVSDGQVRADPDGQYVLGEIVGKAGVERQFDADLRGRRGWKQVVVNSLGREIQEIEEGRRPTPGHALRLNLDLDLQQALEEAYGTEAGSAVFLDPNSGAVLAMISRPAFDPNTFARRFSEDAWKNITGDSRHPLQDRASLSKFAPGSVFKIVIAIAALEEGVAGPDRTDFCRGEWRFGGRSYRCWARSKGGHGLIGMRDAITHSCNVYFYQLGDDLGIERIARWARKLGFGSPTGIDLPHEESGTVPDPEWKSRAYPGDPKWHPGETISVSIGQGALEVTPLQMAVFAATIANGGTVYRPRLIQARETREGVEEELQAGEVVSKVALHPATLAVIRDAMWAVVNDRGTGGRARIQGRDVCAKTGTAQVYRESRDTDADDLEKAKRDHAWFVGFAPKDDPKLAWAVFVQHGGHGGTTAAPIARAVLERYFNKHEPATGGETIARATSVR